jgi:hypothetical protein
VSNALENKNVLVPLTKLLRAVPQWIKASIRGNLYRLKKGGRWLISGFNITNLRPIGSRIAPQYHVDQSVLLPLFYIPSPTSSVNEPLAITRRK